MKIAKVLGVEVKHLDERGKQRPVLYIQRTQTKPWSRPPYT